MAFLPKLLFSLFFFSCLSSEIPPFFPSIVKPFSLLPPKPLVLQYHKGHLITSPGSVNLYIFWYGRFTTKQKSIILDFFGSFNNESRVKSPSVRSWWSTTGQYKDSDRATVTSTVRLTKQASDDSYSQGRMITRRVLQNMVRRAIFERVFRIDLQKGIYLVLTSGDVGVERFCMGSCGFHEALAISSHSKVLFGWVGNAREQCPGECAWPFGVGQYGPPGPPLGPPNGDVGMDGMVINIATLLAGTVTNPYNSGYFQGDPLAPLEAVTACSGIFGIGAYPGYPGKVLVDPVNNASFNAFGVGKRRFMLPAMWSPMSVSCKTTLA